mgnify:FL=1
MNMTLLKTISLKILRLVFGLFVFALGTVCMLNAKIGVASWDVLHQGISNVTGLTVGRANIYLGFIILAIDFFLGQDIGWSTLANMILIGIYVDILMINNLVPIFEGFLPSLILLLVGIIIQGIGFFIYISVGWGAGPRDGLMVVLMKKTGKSVRLIKSFIEVLAVAVGFLLGGNLGIGTIIVAFFSGPIWQYVFKLIKFNVNEVEHRFIKDDIRFIKEKFQNSSNNI